MAVTVSEQPNQTLTLELSTPTEDDQPVYVAGSFNAWRVADAAYELKRTDSGTYQLVLDVSQLPETIEYKYSRGSWETVELDQDGNERNNRRVTKTARIVRDEVPRWKQSNLVYRKEYLPIIEVINESFEIPQLIRTRRIAALLPYDYHKSDRRYPVLYLQDGQNLFDDYAPFGNWAVDKQLALLAEKGLHEVIIVAIDHAQEKRIVEFTPSYRTRLGRGEGKRYVRFLADTLKPYVDKHFRTKTDWANTGIGGSSMGGLISIYAGIMYPEVYGRLMIFSPSLWVTPNVPFQLINLTEPYSGRVYLYGGKKEKQLPWCRNLERFSRDAMVQQDVRLKPEFFLSIDPEGEHNEWRWGEEFPKSDSVAILRQTKKPRQLIFCPKPHSRPSQ